MRLTVTFSASLCCCFVVVVVVVVLVLVIYLFIYLFILGGVLVCLTVFISMFGVSELSTVMHASVI